MNCRLVIFMAMISLLSVSYASIDTEGVLSCKPEFAYACKPSLGCKEFKTTITEVVVDLKSQRYYRCEATECSTRDINVSLSGIFLYASYENGAGAIKIATSDTEFTSKYEFMDNASLMFMNITMYGVCTEK